jgi:hypothetical protein
MLENDAVKGKESPALENAGDSFFCYDHFAVQIIF